MDLLHLVVVYVCHKRQTVELSGGANGNACFEKKQALPLAHVFFFKYFVFGKNSTTSITALVTFPHLTTSVHLSCRKRRLAF